MFFYPPPLGFFGFWGKNEEKRKKGEGKGKKKTGREKEIEKGKGGREKGKREGKRGRGKGKRKGVKEKTTKNSIRIVKIKSGGTLKLNFFGH